MLKFKSEDTFFLRRDPNLPVFLVKEDTKSLSLGQQIQIDDTVRTVKGVERFRHSGWSAILVEAL